MFNKEERVRFWAKVDVKAIDECWLWTGASQENGRGMRYGRVQFDGCLWYSHRAAYAMVHGEPDALVCHKCDVSLCCNPTHLFSGSSSDNVQDAIKKGRMAAKLTEDDIRLMRHFLLLGISQSQLGIYFSVNKSTIASISQGRKWKHVR